MTGCLAGISPANAFVISRTDPPPMAMSPSMLNSGILVSDVQAPVGRVHHELRFGQPHQSFDEFVQSLIELGTATCRERSQLV